MFNYEKVIPAAIPMRRYVPNKFRQHMDCFNSIALNSNINRESKETSKLFREKVEADLKRVGLR